MIGPALDELDLSATLAELRAQEEQHGHTAESDAERPITSFSDVALKRSAELADVLRPGDRQNLAVAYRRAARLAAFAISIQRRIRFEQDKQRSIEHGTD